MKKKGAKKAARKTPGQKKRLPAGAAKLSKGKAPSKSKADPAEPIGFPIVGVCASAGGLEALKELFSHLPAETNMGFVVVTHQHPGHTSMLAELLGEATPLPVTEATEGMVVKPDHVYVAPPGGLLAIMNRRLHRLEAIATESKRLPIDSFLRSLAQDQRERAICIILSGTGTDGTLGLKAIKGESGMAMVQKAESAQYAGMPSSAAATGLADYVLAPAEMAKQLLNYAQGPYLRSVETPTVPDAPMQRIFLLLRDRTGHDFSGYKSSTIRRRIERRLNVHGIDKPDDYMRYLQDNPYEIDILFKELLISVTSFFRDPDVFESLVAGPLRTLLESRPDNYTIRIWVPGCSTGEECYSLAMALRETMLHLNRHFEVQIFGTDLDAQAIETARAGSYPDGIAGDVTPERLERFFTRHDGAWRVRKEIREMCIFALQNVIKDAPFTKMDLVSCRNLLIYLGADLQKKLLPVFHYALKPGGLLILGPSESIGNMTDLFETENNKAKIFRRIETVQGRHALLPLSLAPFTARGEPVERETGTEKTAPSVPTQIERLLLNWYCPASVVVNGRGDIVHIHGRTGAFLEPASGLPRMNVLEMARQGLNLELSHALRRAAREKKEVVRENIAVKPNGDTIYLDLIVARVQDPETLRGLFVITFRPVPPPPKGPAKRKPSPTEREHAEEMERELQFTKESLQSTIEELETSNEELKSTNEELQSTNEELQSTNEELETSKEEMQSLNEELTTVNAELGSKLEALAHTNDDMQNLLNSTDIATVFLDNQLNIKRYTERAKSIIRLIPTDVGRPIGDLVSKLDYEELEEDCRGVFRTLKSRDTEVQTKSGISYLMRIVPYRTSDNVIDGLVLTFVEIAQIQRTANLAHAYFKNIVQTVRHPLVVLDTDLRVKTCNPAFAMILDSECEAVEGQLLFQISGGVWNVPTLRKLLEQVLPQDHRFEEFRIEVEFPEEQRRVFLLNARQLEAPPQNLERSNQ